MADVQIRFERDLSPEMISELEDRIHEFNVASTGHTDGQTAGGVAARCGGCADRWHLWPYLVRLARHPGALDSGGSAWAGPRGEVAGRR